MQIVRDPWRKRNGNEDPNKKCDERVIGDAAEGLLMTSSHFRLLNQLSRQLEGDEADNCVAAEEDTRVNVCPPDVSSNDPPTPHSRSGHRDGLVMPLMSFRAKISHPSTGLSHRRLRESTGSLTTSTPNGEGGSVRGTASSDRGGGHRDRGLSQHREAEPVDLHAPGHQAAVMTSLKNELRTWRDATANARKVR